MGRFDPQYLRTYMLDIQMKLKVREDIAEVMADSLLHAEMRGVRSHGIVRLETYMKRVEAGVMSKEADPTVVRDFGAVSALDANGGFGQWAGYQAMLIANEKAKRFGIGMVSVANSNHYGASAYFAEMASKEGLIGFNISNCSPAVAPFNAKEPIFGTNPIGMSFPMRDGEITIDMATTVVAKGKLRLAMLAGKDIPLGWAKDAEGNQTSDPKAALDGTLEAIGGVKGCALTAMIELMCGQLTNSAKAGTVRNITDVSGQAKNGHIFCSMNIEAFLPTEVYFENVDDFCNMYKRLTPVNGEILRPGEYESNSMKLCCENGIELVKGTIDSLARLGEKYNVAFEAGGTL